MDKIKLGTRLPKSMILADFFLITAVCIHVVLFLGGIMKIVRTIKIEKGIQRH